MDQTKSKINDVLAEDNVSTAKTIGVNIFPPKPPKPKKYTTSGVKVYVSKLNSPESAAICVDIVEQAYQLMAARGLGKLIKRTKIYFKNLEKTIGSCSAAGYAVIYHDVIYIDTGFAVNSPEMAVHTVIHELGHKMDYSNIFSSLLVADIEGSYIFKKYRGTEWEVSAYAGTDSSEFFAEMFLAYVLGTLPPEPTRWLKKWIMWYKVNHIF